MVGFMKLKLDLSLRSVTARRGSSFWNLALTRLTSWIAVFCLSAFAHAASVTGVVKVKEGARYLQLPESTALFEMRPSTEEAKRNLERLADQDFYQGQGEFFGTVFLVQTVDFVGLYSLLGPWHSKQDRALVTFESYNTLSIFNPRTLGYDRVAMFDYSVAPDTGSRWKIFVSGAQSVSIATMKIERERLVLQFINLDTGAFEKPLELVRKNP